MWLFRDSTVLLGLVHSDSQLALEKLFPVESAGHGDEPRWHDGRTVEEKAPAHDLIRTDHVPKTLSRRFGNGALPP